MYLCMYVCMYVPVCVCVCIYIYIYIYIYWVSMYWVSRHLQRVLRNCPVSIVTTLKGFGKTITQLARFWVQEEVQTGTHPCSHLDRSKEYQWACCIKRVPMSLLHQNLNSINVGGIRYLLGISSKRGIRMNLETCRGMLIWGIVE
jgi:hypothetical protein